MEMEKKLEIKHRMRRHEILKNKKKQMFLAKKAEMDIHNMKPMPKIKISETAQKVLKNIKSLKNKKLLKRLKDTISHESLKGKTRYNILKEMKNKLEQEEIEKKKQEQNDFFIKMAERKLIRKKKTEKNFGLLRF